VLLTPTEFAMLKRLLDCPDGVSYDGFSEATRQGVVENNTINTHIAQIRHKFKAVDGNFNAIKTRYGFGYKLSLE
jgi:DNA-binding response OmpR family regulator